MEIPEDRDSWLEGVRRWYFGGAPGPDDEVDKAGVDALPELETCLPGLPPDR